MLYFNYTTDEATASVGYVTPAGSAAEAAILAASPPSARLDSGTPSTNLDTAAVPKHNLTTMMVGQDLGGNDMGGGNSSVGACWHLPLGTQATVSIGVPSAMVLLRFFRTLVCALSLCRCDVLRAPNAAPV